MQLTMNVETKEELNNTWAFAICQNRPSRRVSRSAIYEKSVIASCSKQAKILGIRAGMPCKEAKEIVPEIKILVIGERNL